MAESLPQYATLATRNHIVDDGATLLSVTSQQSLFTKENLLSPLRSKRVRSLSSSVQWQLVGQLATPKLPTVLALIDSNLAASKAVTWELADDQGMTSNKLTWNFTTYAQDWTPKTRTGRHVLRWFPGTPDTTVGSVSARSFFRLTFAANSTLDSDGDGVADSYFELGTLFVGSYARLPINLGFEREIDDPSELSESDGGAVYPDRRPAVHKLSNEAPLLNDASSIAMLRALDDAGTTRHCLLDLWGWTSDATKKADSCYYGRVERVRQTRFVQMFDRLTHSFIEARA